ncbi:MAG: hypothetical protein CL942_16365 [Desulfovibrio sp.]|nr:hypothetical protein [Desulfovibrio sp.]MBC18612.1 hypothetical protein [Desulfovibrio sp.]|tara:strand:+ start:6438 stop:7355 length:918 start_codon:yes stop_codon:yes gene_type:complete
MARNPYQMDPFLAQGFSNLTKALIGDPQTDYQVARTGLAQSQTRGQDLKNTMNQNIADALVAIQADPQVQGQIAKAFGFDDQTIGALSPDILGNLATLAYGQGGNTQQTTAGFGNISSSANQQRGFEQMTDTTLPLEDQAAGFSAYSGKAPTGRYNPSASKTPPTKLTSNELGNSEDFMLGYLEEGGITLPQKFVQQVLTTVTNNFTEHRNQLTANTEMSELLGQPVKLGRGLTGGYNVDTTTGILNEIAEILVAFETDEKKADKIAKKALMDDFGYEEWEAEKIIASDELFKIYENMSKAKDRE